MSKIRRLKGFMTKLLTSIRDRIHRKLTVVEMINKAIKKKRLLEFDHSGYHRIVEPHVYASKNEKDGILAYQLRGESSTGIMEWKRMYLVDITNMKVLTETFPGRREVNGLHSGWDVIYRIVT